VLEASDETGKTQVVQDAGERYISATGCT